MVRCDAGRVVTLRDVTLSDLPRIFVLQADAESAAMAGVPSRDQTAFDAHWTRLLSEPTGIQAVVLDGEVVVGWVVAWDAETGREVGYWIDRSHWGRGLATAALGLLLERETTRPLRAGILATNVASQRVLERHGFVEVARVDDGVDFVLAEG